MVTVTFSLTDPSAALIKGIMDIISKHEVNVPGSLKKALKSKTTPPANAAGTSRARSRTRTATPARKAAPKTQQVNAQRARSTSRARSEAAKRRQQRSNIANNVIEHCEKWARHPDLIKAHGVTNYKAVTPYAMGSFRLDKPQDVLRTVNTADPLGSLKNRLLDMGFPNASMNNTIVVFEFAKQYIVALFPGAKAFKSVRVPKDTATSAGEAKRFAVVSKVGHINSYTDINDLLPFSYLETIKAIPDDESDSGSDPEDVEVATDAVSDADIDDVDDVNDTEEA
ncbi:putative coat protein [Ligustrum chlorotic spot virus]|uniref:putative coat protein n=1 Tax=Ligustrum chlorotic spot virus TaxID=2921791 RepID=UPI0024833B84|nr:putative coat protein [Ligustrum chlorotic spot virus]UNH55553.1 putative coat protein [Ligustrum chlorotic spot virus]